MLIFCIVAYQAKISLETVPPFKYALHRSDFAHSLNVIALSQLDAKAASFPNKKIHPDPPRLGHFLTSGAVSTVNTSQMSENVSSVQHFIRLCMSVKLPREYMCL
jgi:hypothetical protein